MNRIQKTLDHAIALASAEVHHIPVTSPIYIEEFWISLNSAVTSFSSGIKLAKRRGSATAVDITGALISVTTSHAAGTVLYKKLDTRVLLVQGDSLVIESDGVAATGGTGTVSVVATESHVDPQYASEQ
jgi:hypothetical protein